jgi:uncharacterized protein (DUF1697 family)
MTRYVALLRGINVGGHRITMDELRRHFVALKFDGVESFIASGNILFNTASTDVAGLENRIERHLARKLGYEVPAFLRTLSELAAALKNQPFAPDDVVNESYSRYLLFLQTPLPETLQDAITRVSCATDEFHVLGREIHWLCRGKISDETPAAKAFGKLLQTARVDATSRNIKMLHRLAAQEVNVDATASPPEKMSPRITRAGTSRAGRARKG